MTIKKLTTIRRQKKKQNKSNVALIVIMILIGLFTFSLFFLYTILMSSSNNSSKNNSPSKKKVHDDLFHQTISHLNLNNKNNNRLGSRGGGSNMRADDERRWHKNDDEEADQNDDEGNGSEDEEEEEEDGNDENEDPKIKLKKEYEKLYPPNNYERSYSYLYDNIRSIGYKTFDDDLPYNIRDCPDEPPPNYPYVWNIIEVLDNWNPDETQSPGRIYQSLCIFDYDTEYEKALTYRNLELPFIIKNNPILLETSERWMRNDGKYLKDLLGNTIEYKTEYSDNNHFMYWKINKFFKKNPKNLPKNWKEPTKIIKTTYDKWLYNAKKMDKDYDMNGPNNYDITKKEHWYFRINSMIKAEYYKCIDIFGIDSKNKDGIPKCQDTSFMYNELPIFHPNYKPDNNIDNFFMVNPKEQRGINCRFGMKGIIAEAHYDSSRNFIVLLGGERRYILAHPNQCTNLELYPKDHPSGRHSKVDWSDNILNLKTKYKHFPNAEVNEVVLQAGDALYLPTFWFHYIVSLNVNYQCNARSGTTKTYENDLKDCGFL